jgi:hypothetical protein
MIAVQTPYTQFFATDGSPLDNGYLYIGLVSQNPETAPAQVFWDFAGTQPAAQPIRLLNGYPARDGTPTPVFTPEDYSFTVKNARGGIEYTSLGSTLMGWIRSAINAVGSTLSMHLNQQDCLLSEFLTPVQLADWQSGACTIDLSFAVQSWLNHCKLKKRIARVDGYGLINTTISVSSWVGAVIQGEGFLSGFRKTTAGDLFVFPSMSRATIKNFALSGTGMASGNGLTISGAGVGVNTIKGMQFSSFPARGLYLAGAIATPQSGNIIEDNIFLSNGILIGTAQAEYNYANDSHWARNQYGTLDLGGPYPTIGAKHFSCQAGDFEFNYHWENLVGATYENCDFTRFVGNRWEENQREGVKVINTSRCSFSANHLHTNSKQSSGTYDGMTMASCGSWAWGANHWYTFSSVLTRYCLSLDSTCSSQNITGNFFDAFTTAPVLYDTSSFEILLTNNLPRGYGLNMPTGIRSSFNSSLVATNQITFAGTSGSSFINSETLNIVTTPSRALKFRVNVSAQPGVGQTCTVTLQKNGIDTTAVATFSGLSPFTIEVVSTTTFAIAESYNFKVVNSNGAAPVYVFGTIEFSV